MDKKEPTDEEIVKALEHCATENTCRGCVKYNEETTIDYFKCMRDTRKNVVDLFHRLQAKNAEQKAEIERLTSLYDGQTAFMTSRIGDLPLTVEGLRKAVDEISRLLIVQTELQELNSKYYNEAKDLRRENAELQKQVDVLTAEKENLYFLNKNLEDYIDNHEPIWKRNTEQAVKDTAKEILQDLYYEFNRIGDEGACGEIRLRAEEYGVEVE